MQDIQDAVITEQQITETEMKTFRDRLAAQNQLFTSLGLVEYQLANLKAEHSRLVSALDDSRKAAEQENAELVKKYGPGSLDLTTGKFRPLRKTE